MQTTEREPVQHGLKAFVSGQITEEIIELHDDIQVEVDRLVGLQERIESGQYDTLKDVLRDIVNDARIHPESEEAELITTFTAGDEDHIHMPLLEASTVARIPAWLHGEAGSGKSTAAEHVADRQGLDFRSIALCPTTSKSDLLGYRDATGTYRSTGFRDTYENGGVFLFDEIDNAHPSTLAVMNHALANTIAEFPDRMVERHPDAILVAAANTIGRGANAQYVGRAVIDAATRDRFVYIPWDIDESLEERLVIPGSSPKSVPINLREGGIPSPHQWLDIVLKHRDAIELLGLKVICSPRASLYGAQLARLGLGRKWLQEMCIYKGMPDADREKLQQAVAGKLESDDDF